MDEIRRTMVTIRQGTPIYIEDIATVEDSHQEIRHLVRVNASPASGWASASSRSQHGAGGASVDRAIERINRDYPQVRVYSLYDTSKFITRAVGNVRNAAFFGSLLAVFILLVFLRNFRSVLVVAISIPISVLAAFGLMYFSGFTLNVITFGGLALGVGVLVDNAIVVLENIFRHRQEGEEKKAAARNATKEVALAITASTLTTIAVFIPVVFMSGMSGLMFNSWLGGLVLAVQFAPGVAHSGPLLSSRFIRVREPDRAGWLQALSRWGGQWMEGLDRSYVGVLAGPCGTRS